MSDNIANRPLNDVVADFVADVSAARETEHQRQAELAQRETKAKESIEHRRKDAETKASDFARWLTSVLTGVQTQLRKANIEARVTNYWDSRTSNDPRRTPATFNFDGRSGTKLLTFTFENHPTDPTRQSIMIFAVATDRNAKDEIMDRFIIHAGIVENRTGGLRTSLIKDENISALFLTESAMDQVVNETFALLMNESKKRRGV